MVTKKKASKKAPEQEGVVLQPMRINTLKMRIIGESPLVIHRFSDKAKDEIKRNQSGEPKSKKKAPRDPKAEFEAARWLDVEGKPSLPALYFKKCITTAAYRFYDETRVGINGLIWVRGDTAGPEGEDMVRLKFKSETMHEGTVRLGGISRPADMRYRPMYTEWSCSLIVDYDKTHVSKEQLMEYIRRGGFSVGLCEWRPEKGGPWGKFRIAGKDD